ncbi:MAG: DNA methyltransferase [Candidatus Muiribacteriota bacterium]
MIIKQNIIDFLINFSLDKNNEKKTSVENVNVNGIKIIKFINEYWTSKQRQGHSIHEISYRACYKSELPGFFINLFTEKNDIVYDPFGGRGTTVVEAALLERNIIQNDINPLSQILSKPRIEIPELSEVSERLNKIDFSGEIDSDLDLSMFYEIQTMKEISSLRKYLISRKHSGQEDYIDSWIRMVATNRLTGHSKGFFSVYTLPPNQAVSQERQIKINNKRNQTPEYKNVKEIIIKKSKSLLKDFKDKEEIEKLRKIAAKALFLEKDASETYDIKSATVNLIVTSPPFLDIVQYAEDNWLRCWFNNIDVKQVSKKIIMAKSVEKWSEYMSRVFREFYRILKKDAIIAFEVGEVKKGKIDLAMEVVKIGLNQNFECFGILINQQKFTKTANIWGVTNNSDGTNSNRVVIFQKK